MSKYNNKKVTIGKLSFDSKKEHQRYQQLTALEQQGLISQLETQKRFELIPSVKYKHAKRAKPAIRYYADFVYVDTKGELVVEDVKSPATRKNPAYVIKKHLMMALKNIEISEI